MYVLLFNVVEGGETVYWIFCSDLLSKNILLDFVSY